MARRDRLLTVILGFAGSTLGFPRGALLRPSGPQCDRSHRAAGGVFALESNLIVCARKFDRRPPTPGGKNGGYAYVYDCTIIFRKRLERIV
jgi:hypothetical protein